MKIKKSTVNKLMRGMLLREYTFKDIADACGVNRQAVTLWMQRGSIPDKHIEIVEEITGVQIK